MKVERVPLQRLSLIRSFQDLDAFRASEVSVFVSSWAFLDIEVLNVFAPRGHAFFNLRGQKQLEEISFNQGQAVVAQYSVDEIEADLRAAHLNKGDPAAFLLTGEITQHFGDHFAAFPENFPQFLRRHFSLAVSREKSSRALDFLVAQGRSFGETGTISCSEGESFVFTGIDNASQLQRILSCTIADLSLKDIDYCSNEAELDLVGLPGLWSDPCPIRLIDEAFELAPQIIKHRLRALEKLATFPVLRHWQTRIDDSDVYPFDLSSQINAVISSKLAEHKSICSWKV